MHLSPGPRNIVGIEEFRACRNFGICRAVAWFAADASMAFASLWIDRLGNPCGSLNIRYMRNVFSGLGWPTGWKSRAIKTAMTWADNIRPALTSRTRGLRVLHVPSTWPLP